ncbi:hypothetical protein DPMN_117022 [Dreissena polymorpha]|uniref:C2H2-type domain-containing protein n=1 Tax=Dreissena polymorpha TaxID=45954 RepID=A0A9D4KP48_DREPO|nr:hypothetical protein DPMN_117022 [Dreissena polymorpha]
MELILKICHMCVFFCGDALKTKRDLKLHDDRHIGLSKYSCCEKLFSRKEALTRHMRVFVKCSVHWNTRQHVLFRICHQNRFDKTPKKRGTSRKIQV